MQHIVISKFDQICGWGGGGGGGTQFSSENTALIESVMCN